MTRADDLGVHPVAALFPMLPDDELDELAADIKQNGLIHPIVLDANRVLIDGRNRLEACIRAGVQPTFTELNGHDPVAFILGANVARRHLALGQRAMATVQSAILAGLRIPHGWAVETAATMPGPGTAQSKAWALSCAYTVCRHAPDLVGDVLGGGSLKEAYAEARRRERLPKEEARRRQQAEQDEARRVAAEEKLRASIALAVEEVGPELPIPPRDEWPSLEARLADLQRPPTGKPAETETLKHQQAYLKRLIALRNKVADLRREPLVTGGWWPDGQAAAVRSAVSQIVTDALEIAATHGARGGQQMRKVK